MAAAIEANLNVTFSLLDMSPSTLLYDDDPDLRLYISPKVPFSLFNHVYFTRLPQQEDVHARIEEVRQHFAAHQVPFMWSVGPFSRPSALASHLVSHGLRRDEKLSGMAVDLKALNEDIPREFVEVMRVGFEMPARRAPSAMSTSGKDGSKGRGGFAPETIKLGC